MYLYDLQGHRKILMGKDSDNSENSLETISLLQQTLYYKIYFASFGHAIEMHSLYNLPLPSSYNKVFAWVVYFSRFLCSSSCFFPDLNRRDTSVSIDYRTRNGDYAGVVIDQSCAGCVGRVRSSQQATLLHPCGVIFLYYRVHSCLSTDMSSFFLVESLLRIR